MKYPNIFPYLGLVSVQIGLCQDLEIDYNSGTNSCALTWESVPDRSYFLQMSDSLDDWEYCPLIWYGDGTNLGTNVSVAPGVNLFYRLVHTDYEVAGGNPSLEDFDNDGLTNLNEVTSSYGTNPFSKDTDRDWMTDSDEITWNLSDPVDPDSDNDGTGDGNEDFDNDGWENWRELAMVSPPTVNGTSAYAPGYVTVGAPGSPVPALRFRCLPDAGHGYHYRVQGSPNLFTWEDINHYENGYGPSLPAGTLGTANTDPVLDGTGAHNFTVGIPVGSNYQFLRLDPNFEPFPGHSLRTEDDVTPQTLKAHSDAHFDTLVPDNEFSRQIFDHYVKDEDCIWSKWCWTNQVDFTGTAWENDRFIVSTGNNVPTGPYSACEFTLVSPRHIIASTHFMHARGLSTTPNHSPINTNTKVVFFDRDGNQVVRYLTKYAGTNCDISVGILNKAVPSSVKFYKILPPRWPNGEGIDWSTYLDDARTLNTVRERECALYQVNYISGCQINFGIRNDVLPWYRLDRGFPDQFIGGDSSNPQFVFLRGEPVLVAILWFQGLPGSGPFISNPSNFDNVNSRMLELGGDAQLTTVKLKL